MGSWLKDTLGSVNLLFTLWTWLGALAGILFAAGVALSSTGLEVFANVAAYLGATDGFLGAVSEVGQWFTERSTLVVPVATLIAVAALSVLFCGSFSRYSVPSGPGPATFYIALLAAQVAGGPDLAVLIVGPLAICAFWWFVSDNGRRGGERIWSRLGMVAADLLAQLLFAPLVLALAMLVPKEGDNRVFPVD